MSLLLWEIEKISYFKNENFSKGDERYTKLFTREKMIEILTDSYC